ncbi:BTB/POZ domain-containing protein At2g30600 [Andrographis paniculata]|uniref:BTB/POZ domain-containing protein At2g30600 n=1 Tax=Andrographis paniculata TaxID=175694 RepID=UPI0021E79FFE|nr:BTB/POZ domain-containing protein At2g30600 [Andrographis paniculata]XP_051126592.1 BTB/POZ domain-containing protein At2g30600 [Andrographis paniculata]XP_051126593.1 BTB/POZ domain-containing protein At2g30600 [Andrographis paniculata]XP_051126594.1 BTB/POZ domain-containing protein At2g30600 [Andrographis paniculata]XP_051126595.1 BTB/POZ domain-containing protein At2g30600 [Andrographis paniculata]XP_051126596.1 BTB/POZ domain-containing protein At2g30600 [Andrographis paniculata]
MAITETHCSNIMEKKKKNFLTVAPFECAWHDELRFKEAGRGCVAFDAFAHNDVTIVFRETAGSQHYHYKKDNSPHYTVIIGSHRNKRLNIEVSGKTVVDVAGVDLHCSSTFQSYWISIYDGLISIGKGRYPFQNLVFQWLDSNPNCSVQYIGLSSWDRHVGYRNVNVMPLTQNHISLWKHVECSEFGSMEDSDDEGLEEDSGDYENWGLENFLENWELSDVFFIVGREERAVPAHKVVLAAAGNFNLSEDCIHLQDVCYPIFHALLEYIYTGKTKVPESHLSSLKALSLRFEVCTIAKQCDEMMERFKLNKKLFESGNAVEISFPSYRLNCHTLFPSKLPIDVKRLNDLRNSGKYSDVELYVEGCGLLSQSHRIILGLWSVAFTKMFTNGMTESMSTKICLRDVCYDTFKIMLDFMYTGEVNEDVADNDIFLLQLLLLADQFGVSLLHQECCKRLLEHLSEDSVCETLQVISSIPACKLIEERCERKFSMHFDYCTSASIDFVLLDEATFRNILQHPELTVTSEERVLVAILLWCCKAEELFGWDRIDEMLLNTTAEVLFGDRLYSLEEFLNLVRFPLLPHPVLQKLERSNLSLHLPSFNHLVKDAINYQAFGLSGPEKDLSKFRHRRSSFKELQYICDGDSNGVLYFVGTSYGEHQWVNPVLCKKVTITASSPLSRFTDPKVLVSRCYQGMSFAGPRLEDGRNTAWWMVDIGQGHQLMCNYYTLRQDGSRSFIRDWSLQGSMDGHNWTNLRVHERDETICKPGQFASWPIIGPNALLPFRYFRVVLNAPTTDSTNPWCFSTCFLELYGYFR